MRKVIGLLIFCMIFISFSEMGISEASPKSKYLTKEQSIVPPVTFYDSYGEQNNTSLNFLTNGTYEWKWTIRSAHQFSFDKFSDKMVYYTDFNDIYTAVDGEGKRKWMFFDERANVSRTARGTLISTFYDQSSTLQIIDEEPTTITQHGYLKIYNSDETVRATLNFVKPNSPFSDIYWLDNNENIIVLEQTGIVSYNKTGQKNWTYGTDILVSEDRLLGTTTNVDDIYFSDLNGYLIVEIGNKKILLDDQGKLVNGEKIAGNLQSSFIDYDDFNKWKGGSYETGEGANLIAKNLSGKIKWNYKLRKYGPPENIVANSKGHVFFSDVNGNIYGLDEMGNEMFCLLRNNSALTLTELLVDNEGDLIGITDNIGMFKIGLRKASMRINGELFKLTKLPVVKSGVVLVPYRNVLERLGFKVVENQKTHEITGKLESKEIRFKPEDSTVYLNGKQRKLTVGAESHNGTTYIPLQLIAEVSGLEMEWDPSIKEARLGTATSLAQNAVERFLLQVEQGDEVKIKNSLVKSNNLNLKVAKLLGTHQSFKQIYDLKSISVKAVSKDEMIVETVQRNQQYFQKNQAIFDKVMTNHFTINRMKDGQWKISDFDI
ncbi:copper amine oxidase N-terminal domain-containing protein [Paenibacillus sp. FSL P2-0136]|uniref:copper amine oxidase N-terminal domain-containing protein n=1 Tax=unclassified Paenibacillus TaxID=185978 RepID=UPI0030D71E45